MALLFNLKKSMLNILKRNHITFCERGISSSSVLWFDHRFLRPSTFKEKEKRFLGKDKIPQNYQLIYKAPMEYYVSVSMHVSTATATLIGLAAIFQSSTNKVLEPLGSTLSIQSDDIYFFAAGFLAINAILRLVGSIFPLRIYKDQARYIAVFQSQLPFGTSQYHFEKGQVHAVNYKCNPWNNVTYKLAGKTSLLLEDYFKTPSEFHQMFHVQTKNKTQNE